MNEPRVGSARIVRVDTHNVAVEVYVEVEVSKKVGNKRVKTGATRREWKESGYYGGNLLWAAESALYQSLPFGEVVTPDLIKKAVAEIVKNCGVKS